MAALRANVKECAIKTAGIRAPHIRVRDLLNHIARLGTDDPWGDRQTPLPEPAFTQLLRNGVVFSNAPGVTMESSNPGYAMLGRFISNVSGQPFADAIATTLMRPLGMTSSCFFADAAPRAGLPLG